MSKFYNFSRISSLGQNPIYPNWHVSGSFLQEHVIYLHAKFHLNRYRNPLSTEAKMSKILQFFKNFKPLSEPR